MNHIKKFNEGVADEYAEKRFYFENPNKDFEYKYQNYISKIPPVAYVKDPYDKKIALFKNPKTLKNFEDNVRAIGTSDGDLYVAQRNMSFYHSTMGEALELVEKGSRIYDLNTKFVFFYRLRNENAFAIGISTETYNDLSKKNEKITEDLLKKIKRKNPQFDFYNYSKSQLYSNKKPPVILDITEPYKPEQKTSFSFGTDSEKQGIFTKYKKFIKNESMQYPRKDSSNPIEREKYLEQEEKDKLKEKIQEEFSKHLKETSANGDFKSNERLIENEKIFLLNDDYGCRIFSITAINRGIYRYNTKFIVQVCSIKNNPTTNGFRNGTLVDVYDSEKNISVEDFVKKFVDKLKRTNEQRLKNRETVKLKRISNKFNL